MKVIALIERRIDRLLGSQESHITEDWADTRNCPFTGKLMVQPMIAGDNITYEKVEIERWIILHKSNLKSPVTGEPMSQVLIPNRAVEWQNKTYREEHQIPVSTPKPCESTELTQEALLSRLAYSFRWYTKYKFTQYDPDIMSNPFKTNVPYTWWPITHARQRFIKTAWAACSAWRQQIYINFAEALQRNIENIKSNAHFFYVNSLLENTYDSKTEQIFKALTACMIYHNLLDQDMPKVEEYRANHYKKLQEFWGEKPPEPVPIPVVRRSQPQPPSHHTEPRGTYYYDAWPPR